MDNLRRLLDSKLDQRLREHIKDIHLTSLSRLSTDRIETTALPNIGQIEMVSGQSFSKSYNELYISNFYGGERERSDLIVARLQDSFSGKRIGLAPFHIIGIKDPAGQAIAAAHFSILPLRSGECTVPYLQYIYVRPQNRRQDLSEILHTLILAVASGDAALKGPLLGRVPFTLFETQPADDAAVIHARSGSKALVIRRKSDGKVVSAHVQPGLEKGEPPLTLVWAVRGSPRFDLDGVIDRSMGLGLVEAYYQSLRDECFLEEQIVKAEKMIARRLKGGGEFVLMPLGELKREMYMDVDVDDEVPDNDVETCVCPEAA